MISNYKKIAFKKNPILLYNKIEELIIFRNYSEYDDNIVELLKKIKEMKNEKVRNELLKKIINKVISYSKLNIIQYIMKDIINLNELGKCSPLKYCCYYEKYTPYNIKICEEIKEIILFLIKECKLSIMEVYEKHNYRETIFDMLNNSKNTMNIIIKNNISDYLLINCKNYIIKDLEYMIFNLTDDENIRKYQNKIIFIMYNYNKETFELIIKMLSSKKIINNINNIVISIFSTCYIDKCSMKEYDFSNNHENILNLMVNNFYEYINNINIYNLLNFLWSFIKNINNIKINIKNYIKILFKNVMWKHVIIKIKKLIDNNNKVSNDIIINFILFLDIDSFNILQLYFKKNNIIY